MKGNHLKTTAKSDTIKLTPLGDRLVARAVAVEKKTTSGILLPEEAREKTDLADVLAVGPDVSEVKVGDRILYVKYSPEVHKLDGDELMVLHEEDCLATVGA